MFENPTGIKRANFQSGSVQLSLTGSKYVQRVTIASAQPATESRCCHSRSCKSTGRPSIHSRRPASGNPGDSRLKPEAQSAEWLSEPVSQRADHTVFDLRFGSECTEQGNPRCTYRRVGDGWHKCRASIWFPPVPPIRPCDSPVTHIFFSELPQAADRVKSKAHGPVRYPAHTEARNPHRIG